jgi:hypothetical protein
MTFLRRAFLARLRKRPPTLSPYAASLRALGRLQSQDRHSQ